MKYALDIQNLNKTYNNGFVALRDLNLQIAEGDFFALLGPNGAGKSTTIGILSNLVNKTSGTVKVFDTDLDIDNSKLKSYLGVVPQEFNFGMFEKVFDILTTQAGYFGIPLSIAKIRAEELLKQLGIWDKKDTVSRMLSGGMKRRLMIARALMHSPKILILDEPTAGVDIELRRSMWDFLVKLNAEQKVTIILTTHYLEEAEQLCKNIAIINKGQVIENTSMKNLLSKLDTNTFVLDLKQGITQLPVITNAKVVLKDEVTLEVEVPGQHNLNDIFSDLSRQNIEVIGMNNKSNRLEELFVRFTNNAT
jgi:ABC-2 type transport system ATP-binding protein